MSDETPDIKRERIMRRLIRTIFNTSPDVRDPSLGLKGLIVVTGSLFLIFVSGTYSGLVAYSIAAIGLAGAIFGARQFLQGWRQVK